MATQPPTKDDWQFDESCPRCGESVHIGAIVEETDADGDPIKAEMVCGTDVTAGTSIAGSGCGHVWEWSDE
jgi:hypothetical protein